jgi:hypothetical protein
MIQHSIHEGDGVTKNYHQRKQNLPSNSEVVQVQQIAQSESISS